MIEGRRRKPLLTLPFALSMIVITGFLHGGCGQDAPDGEGGSSTPTVVGFFLSVDTVSLQVGSGADVVAYASYSNGAVLVEAVTWVTMNPAIATVDALGHVHAIAPGLTYITATSVPNPAFSKTASVNVTLGTPPPPTITTTFIPAGRVGTPYSTQITKINGQDPSFWAVVGGLGTPPPGLGIGGSSGILYGTPTAAGTYNFTVRVVGGGQDDQALTCVITGGGGTATAAP